MKRLYVLGFGALLIVVSLVVYHGALGHSRLPEEDSLVWGNPAVADGNLGRAVAGMWEAGDFRPQIRPVPLLLRSFEHLLWDYDRGKYEFDQIVLHGVVGFLLFLLIRKWARSTAAASLAGLLFTVHPAGSQSVLFLGGLSEIVSGVFFLGALLAIAAELHSAPATPPSSRRMVGIGVLALLAMLSKETGFLLPLVGAAMILASRVEARRGRRLLLPLGLAVVAAVAWRLVAISAMGEPLRRVPAIDPTSGVPMHMLLPRSVAGIAVELGALIVPLRLNHDESWLFVLHGGSLYALIAVALVLIAAGIVLAAWRGGSPARTTLTVLVILPLLASGLLPSLAGSLASERTTYLATAGFAGLVILLGMRIGISRRETLPLLTGLAAGLVLLYGIRSSIRTGDYADYDRLLKSSMAVRADNPQVLYEMGNERLTQADYPGAIDLYKRALVLRPDFPVASVNLGAAYLGHEDLGLALRTLDPVATETRHVRALRMAYAKALEHAGMVYMKQERYKEAAEAFEKALLYYPDMFGARLDLGLIYIKAPHYADRGITLLRGVLKEEQDPTRRANVEKGLNQAEGLLKDYIDKHGSVPPATRGALGEPWKVAQEEGM